MKKLTKTAITAAAMATMTLGTVVSVSADNPKNAWVGSGTNYEYYNGNGKKVQNAWVKAGEKWYFLDEDGKMATKSFIRTDVFTGDSEVLDDDDIHDLIEEDDIDDDSKFYYVDASGAMVTGWQAIDASSVYLSPNSTKNGKIWYYFGTSGVMYTDAWILAGENWYAVGSNGQMLTNKLVDEDIEKATGKKYFVDKDGKMITGWYKTTKDDKRGKGEQGEFSKDGLYIYAYEDGSLASNEWVHTNSGWYYLGSAHWPAGHEEDGFELIVWDADDDELDKLRKESNILNAISEADNDPLNRPELNQDIDLEDDAKENDRNYVMLSNKLIKWTNHDKKDTKYFYLQKNGDMITNWYEYQDDYYLCADSDGQLYENAVKSVNGRYYYFNKQLVCNYKEENAVCEYVVEYKADDDETTKFAFYNTTGKEDDTYPLISISKMREDLDPDSDGKKAYWFNNRKVQVKSMTDLEVIAAYAAKNINSVDRDTTTLFDSGEITVYKLRNSSKMETTVSIKESSEGYVELYDVKPAIVNKDSTAKDIFGGKWNSGITPRSEAKSVTGSAISLKEEGKLDDVNVIDWGSSSKATISLSDEQYTSIPADNLDIEQNKQQRAAVVEFKLGENVVIRKKQGDFNISQYENEGVTAVLVRGSGKYVIEVIARDSEKDETVLKTVTITIK